MFQHSFRSPQVKWKLIIAKRLQVESLEMTKLQEHLKVEHRQSLVPSHFPCYYKFDNNGRKLNEISHYAFHKSPSLLDFVNLSKNRQWRCSVKKLFLQACNFIKKESLAQVFSCEFYEISKNPLFTKHIRTTASVGLNIFCEGLQMGSIFNA